MDNESSPKVTQTYLMEEYLMLLMNVFEMGRIRKARAFRLDEAVIDGLTELAKQENISANRLLENMLFEVLKNKGVISADVKPLGETRGGDQKSDKPKEFEE